MNGGIGRGGDIEGCRVGNVFTQLYLMWSTNGSENITSSTLKCQSTSTCIYMYIQIYKHMRTCIHVYTCSLPVYQVSCLALYTMYLDSDSAS